MGYYTAGGDPMGLYTPKANLGVVTSPDSGPTADRKAPRMNVTNVRALRRSMRRVVGFAKIARRVMSFTHSHKMKGRKRGRFGK